jgi:hypothetical protein
LVSPINVQAGVHYEGSTCSTRAWTKRDTKACVDIKILLGHASESAHLRYLPGKETPVAEPIRIRKSWTT